RLRSGLLDTWLGQLLPVLRELEHFGSELLRVAVHDVAGRPARRLGLQGAEELHRREERGTTRARNDAGDLARTGPEAAIHHRDIALATGHVDVEVRDGKREIGVHTSVRHVPVHDRDVPLFVLADVHYDHNLRLARDVAHGSVVARPGGACKAPALRLRCG